MPTKTQSKAALDSANTIAKADIDTTLPAGVNIKDGGLELNPIRLHMILDAGGTRAAAIALRDAILASLTTQAREYNVQSFLGRRSDDTGNVINIFTSLAVYTIVGY